MRTPGRRRTRRRRLVRRKLRRPRVGIGLDKLPRPARGCGAEPQFPQRYFDLVKAQTRASVAQRSANPMRAARSPSAKRFTPPTIRARARIRWPRSMRSRSPTSPRTTGAIPPGPHDLGRCRRRARSRARRDRARVRRLAEHRSAAGDQMPCVSPAHRAVIAIPAQRDVVNARLGQPAVARRAPTSTPSTCSIRCWAAAARSTRLMQEIRVQRGLVYGVSSALLVTASAACFKST